MPRPLLALCLVLGLASCSPPPAPAADDVGVQGSLLTAAERRARAAQIRDTAAAAGLEQGWLLAGIADAETNMSHCWSELTWACMGPYSSDCGGPVVAGAGDGPCSARQGGLGMFQFDAGTYDDTLRREGTRILSIAGNVEAAVDFVVNMVIRSTYISGVDTRAEALAWMNGVRIGNSRWDPWIRTVTHYYNGCAPSYSCFSSRYARYRDYTVNVYNEMGADFWVIARDYAAAYVHQTFPLARDPFELYPGQEVSGYIEMRNTGRATWRPGETYLGTTEPRDVASPIAGPDWVAPNRPATIDRVVAPGETGRFNFTVRAPDALGDYPQFFNLVQEGVAWFSQQGGPPDNQLQVRVTVIEPPPCPAGTSESWSCDGSDRVRCLWGEVVRESCEHGCIADASGAVCAGEPIDADGDGVVASLDCDDSDPSVYPGASEVCDDGIDQDCDGIDRGCGPIVGEGDAAMPESDAGVGPSRPSSLSATCSASAGRSGSAAWLALFAVLALTLRRRAGRGRRGREP
ncbi:MAG TPA: MopE-related protein [Sandaracinaceae bacterium]